MKIKSFTITKLIFGIVNQRPKPFDFATFCTLGIHNDDRGGDSCGIFIDGKYEYGTGANKLFEHFMIPGEGGSKLLHEVDKCQIAFGHCRKASVGVVNEKNAQPVIIEEDGVVKFVVMHNGTIINYKELAKKYIPETNITGMTDSQVMARIFYKGNYEVLGEYFGGATFVIADYRENPVRIFMWMGVSKEYSYSTAPVVERGLNLYIGKHELVFSSEDKFLRALRRDQDNFYVPKENMLVEYTDGKLIAGKVYDRSKCYGKQYTSYSSNTTGHTGCTHTPPTIPATYNNVNTNNTQPTFEWATCDYSIGRVKRGSMLLHGRHFISSYGKIGSQSEANMNEMYFWSGVMLKNKQCFEFLDKFAKDVNSTPEEVYNCYPEFVLYLSPYPYMKTSNGCIHRVDDTMNSSLFTGQMQWPFSSNIYHYNNGYYVKLESGMSSNSLKPYYDCKDKVIDFNEMIDLL